MDLKPKKNRRIGRWAAGVRVGWVHALFFGCHLLLFGNMMLGREAPGFRDTAYLYYPLFEWTADTWLAGDIPLWNRFNNFGAPVVEDCSTSIFYPGKLIFLCWPLSFASRLGWFLFGHGLLASYGAYWTARVLGCCRAGAAIAGLSYALGGSVLFQACNVIFFVSAAWLPWSLGCWWRLFSVAANTGRGFRPSLRTRIFWIVLTAMTLAMMVLGGDPQSAYHSAILGAMMLVAVASCGMAGTASTAKAELSFSSKLRAWVVRWLGVLWRPAISYAAVGLLSLGMAAVQLGPAVRLAAMSERARTAGQAPRTMWELGQSLVSSQDLDPGVGRWDALLGPPAPATHHADVYEFNQPLWTWAQLAWPNITGRWMPSFQRWTLPFEQTAKIWNASIFMGVVPLVLALSGLQLGLFRRRRSVIEPGIESASHRGGGRLPLDRWLGWIAVGAALAATGGLGVVSAAEFLLGRWLGETTCQGWGDQVGSVYWMLTTFLPGYIGFRYPAKLFGIAALALSLLAGRRARPAWLSSPGMQRIAWCLLALTGVLLVLVLLPSEASPGDTSFYDNISRIGAHESMGPFNAEGCYRDVTRGLIGTLVVLCFLLAAGWMVRRRIAKGRQVLVGLTLIVAAELLLANSWMLLPAQVESFCSVAGQRWQTADGNDDTNPNERVGQGAWVRYRWDEFYPAQWAAESSPRRMEEIISWQRSTLHPRFQLQQQVPLVGSANTLELDWARAGYAEKHEPVVDWLGWLERQSTGESPASAANPGMDFGPEPGADPVVRSICGAIVSDAVDRSGLLEGGGFREVGADGQGTRFLLNPRFDGSWAWQYTCDGSGNLGAESEFVALPAQWTGNHRLAWVVQATGPAFAQGAPAGGAQRLGAGGRQAGETDAEGQSADRLRHGDCLLALSWLPGWRARAVPLPDGESSADNESSIGDRDRGEALDIPLYPVRAWSTAVQTSGLPAGRYRIEMRYEPEQFWGGAGISVAAWLAAVILLFVAGRTVGVKASFIWWAGSANDSRRF